MVELEQEKDWLEKSRQGDHTAFENLICCYQRMIHSLAYRMTGSLADADDVTQEVFIRAFQQIDSYRSEAKFSSWLCRIAVNACLNWRQREMRRAEVYRDWAKEARSGGSEKENAALDDDSQRVQAALSRLPPQQRAAIVLTVYEEMSHAQAARALGCSEATVSWRVFAARTKLKRWLKSASRGSPGR
jgi:RNA polymerase sigma-70 factor (ECF subfamily)